MGNGKKRKERKNNIITKGWREEGEITREEIEECLRTEIEVGVKVVRYRRSNKIVVATVEEEEVKKIIMKNKKKLKGKRIFIENDLSWEERKIQEKIGRWVKREKEKGKSVKVGFKWIEGKWKRWNEIEKKEMESET